LSVAEVIVWFVTSDELLASNAALSGEVKRSQEALKIAQLTIEKLKVEVAYLRRMKYGRSSEKLEHPQLELVGGNAALPTAEANPDAEAGEEQAPKSNVTSIETERRKREPKPRPGLRLRSLRQWSARDRAGRLGSAGLRAGHLPCGAPRTPEAGMWRLPNDRASASAEPAGGSVPGRCRAAHAHHGEQVR
jgi:hypothetical protein